MLKLHLLLISTLLASSTLFAIPIIPSMQAQAPTSDLPMTIINETNSSNNTAEDVTNTYNMSQIRSQ
jgi:hypothetical protein